MTRAPETRQIKKLLILGQQKKILGFKSINDGAIGCAAKAEQNDVIYFMSLFLQLPQKC